MNSNFLETIRAVDGEVYNLSYHQKRLENVLESIGVSNKYDLDLLLEPPKTGLYRCRVVYNAKEITVSYLPYKKRNINSLKLIYSDTILYDKKYEQRDSLNELFSKRDSAEDIIIVKNGLITDTTIANIACYDGKIWYTPKIPLLEGTTRQRYLDAGKIVEKDILVEELKSYKKLALMNAMIDFDIIAEEKIEEIIC